MPQVCEPICAAICRLKGGVGPPLAGGLGRSLSLSNSIVRVGELRGYPVRVEYISILTSPVKRVEDLSPSSSSEEK